MNRPLPDVVVAASRLRAAVEHTAAALAGADLDRLLASEEHLLTALNELPLSASLGADLDDDLDDAARSRLRHDVEEAQTALRRCRRLGATLNDVVRCSLDAQGQAPGYDPRRPAAPITGRAFNTRA